MIILFRSCEANLSPSSIGDSAQDKKNKPRWNGHNKLEILRKCYKSIQTGLEATDKIVIVNDRTSDETLDWMETNTITDFSEVDITSLDILRKNHLYPDYHPAAPNECTELMETLLKIADDNPEEIIYVCEDDYLHTDYAILAMKRLFDKGYEGFYAPYDYPDRYTVDTNKVTQVYAGPYSHLRNIPSATLTLAAKGKLWSRYRYEILRAGVFADDSWTWKAFAQVGAVCPIPSHATHLQDGCISPYIDWQAIYNNININDA